MGVPVPLLRHAVLGCAVLFCWACVPPTPAEINRDCPVGEQAGLSPQATLPAAEPLLVVPSGRGVSSYRSQLAAAVAPILAADPGARFELTGVARDSTDGEPAAAVQGRRAELLDLMAGAGIPGDRVTLSMATPQGGTRSEVRLYHVGGSGAVLPKNYCRVVIP